MDSFARHDDYDRDTLDIGDVDPDPLVQFRAWLTAAEVAGVPEPNAMVLSTVSEDGRPTSRTVLLKGIVEGRFEFVTNDGSRKGRALTHEARVALAFPWYPLQRQALIDGDVVRAPAELSDRYWSSRPRGSQVSAWASDQSAPVLSRAELERQARAAEERFAGVTDIPRPPHWGAWLVRPVRIEFWQGRPSRLHDRIVYSPDGDDWRIERLQP
ncbi:pyridoxamine 5'-phosphate oxidase [uncultured Amnibacterium sp.]|uniref:pyridoxamine 5'-phosphate oxidase n=1 Tax=uncultured Amnibacterium sp. TaxID=1631851 RepID=UPI0035CA82A2